MDYAEFSEWQEFVSREPLPEQREDVRAAMLMALIANGNRDPEKRPEPFEIDDFLVDYWQSAEERDEETHNRAMLQKFQAFAARINKQHGLSSGNASDSDRR